jgi:hypothetical protein
MGTLNWSTPFPILFLHYITADGRKASSILYAKYYFFYDKL